MTCINHKTKYFICKKLKESSNRIKIMQMSEVRETVSVIELVHCWSGPPLNTGPPCNTRVLVSPAYVILSQYCQFLLLSYLGLMSKVANKLIHGVFQLLYMDNNTPLKSFLSIPNAYIFPSKEAYTFAIKSCKEKQLFQFR